MKKLAQPIFVLLSILYPFVVYFGHSHMSPLVLAAILFCMIVLRVWAIGWDKPAAKLWLLGGVVVFFSTVVSDEISALLWYPAAVNLVLLVVFAYSLYRPPTIVESFARAHEPNFSDKAIGYTRRVTQVWCVFFLLNGGVAVWTAFYASTQTWALYNGLIAYMLSGLLFVCEWVFRRYYRKKHGT
ncbi:MAG: hypothetical protein WBO07_03970 [Formosimonas sp.]